jgi:hypothetical protein
MQSFPTAVIAALLSMQTAAAQADWHYAKWGMSPEEVVAASNGDAHLVPDSEIKKYRGTENDFITLAKSSHSINGERFTVWFDFVKHSRRLQMINLLAADPSRCYVYRSALIHKYGNPVFTGSNGDLLIWRDQPSGNAVDWVYSPSLCIIRIEPINSDFANAM